MTPGRGIGLLVALVMALGIGAELHRTHRADRPRVPVMTAAWEPIASGPLVVETSLRHQRLRSPLDMPRSELLDAR